MQFLIEQFVEHPKFNNSEFSGVILVSEINQQNIAKLVNNVYFTTNDKISLGNRVELTFNANTLSEFTPTVAVSYQHYHGFYKKRFDDKTPIIKEMAEQHFNTQSECRQNIQSVVRLIDVLKSNFYTDKRAIVLFSGEALKIKIPEWEDFPRDLTEESRQTIDDFIKWIGTDDSDNSDKNKCRKEVVASILTKELSDTPTAKRLEDLIVPSFRGY